MKYFYKFCLAWTRIDLMVARSVGANPAYVATLRQDELEYELLLAMQEINQ